MPLRTRPAAVAGEARGDAAGGGVQEDYRIVGAVSAQAAVRGPVGDVRCVPARGGGQARICDRAACMASALQVHIMNLRLQAPVFTSPVIRSLLTPSW